MIRAVLQDFQRTWPQLLAADLLARAVAFIVLTPSAALILRLLIRRSGSQVIADQDILHFLLTPLGVVTLAVAGAAALAIFLAALALLMTIGLGATRDRLVSYLAAGRFVGRRARGLASLSVHVVLRLLLVAAPFAAAIGLIFVVVLGRHDIYFYLNVKPAEFWIAAALTVLVLLAAARILVPIVLAWTFALPILLFEDATARQALARSQTETPNHRLRIALWLLGWLALTTALGTVASGTVLWVGQRVLPVSQSLPLIAAFLAGILGAVGLVNLLVSFLGSALLALLLTRLYTTLGRGGATEASLPSDTRPLGARAEWSFPGKRLLWGALVAAVAVGVGAVLLVRDVQVEDTTEVTAHRGYSTVAPENTIAAMEAAIAAGADWVEFDVQETADGVVVLLHDSDLMRVAGLRLNIWNTALSDIEDLDAGSWFGPEFASQRVPTLAEVLEICRGRIRALIELKHYGHAERLEERVVEVVEAAGMSAEVALMSLKHESVSRLQELRPDWNVGLLAAVAIGDLTRRDADFLAVNHSIATPGFIRRAHRRGKAVHAWTVNDPVQMSALISRGVDNLITKQPTVARSVLVQREELTPVERLLLQVAMDLGVVPGHEEAPSKPEDA